MTSKFTSVVLASSEPQSHAQHLCWKAHHASEASEPRETVLISPLTPSLLSCGRWRLGPLHLLGCPWQPCLFFHATFGLSANTVSSVLKLHREEDFFQPSPLLYTSLSCHLLPLLVQTPPLFPSLCSCASTPSPGCLQIAAKVISFISFLFLLLLFLSLATLTAYEILIPWPGFEPGSPAVKAWTSNHWTAREFSRVILSSIRQILSCLLQALQCIYCLTQSCVQYCVPSESLFPTLPSPAALQPPLIALLFLCRLRWIYHPGARSARPQKPKGCFPLHPGLCSRLTFICRPPWPVWSSHSQH